MVSCLPKRLRLLECSKPHDSLWFLAMYCTLPDVMNAGGRYLPLVIFGGLWPLSMDWLTVGLRLCMIPCDKVTFGKVCGLIVLILCANVLHVHVKRRCTSHIMTSLRFTKNWFPSVHGALT